MTLEYDDYPIDEPEAESVSEPEVVHDPKVDEARIALEDFFERHQNEVFYERQVEVLFEKLFYHWITNKALYELRQEGRISSDIQQLGSGLEIRFYRSNGHRFWKRQAKEISDLVACTN